MKQTTATIFQINCLYGNGDYEYNPYKVVYKGKELTWKEWTGKCGSFSADKEVSYSAEGYKVMIND